MVHDHHFRILEAIASIYTYFHINSARKLGASLRSSTECANHDAPGFAALHVLQHAGAQYAAGQR